MRLAVAIGGVVAFVVWTPLPGSSGSSIGMVRLRDRAGLLGPIVRGTITCRRARAAPLLETAMTDADAETAPDSDSFPEAPKRSVPQDRVPDRLPRRCAPLSFWILATTFDDSISPRSALQRRH